MTQTILKINSSGRTEHSVTRNMVDQVVEFLKHQADDVQIINRDLNQGLPFIDAHWIEANFTSSESRTFDQQQVLKGSNELVDEILRSDVVLIGSPVYNFHIPAVLKAWIDQVARAQLTFKYTENGPVGLVNNKKAIVVMASGGVPIGSQYDFASPYIKHALSFIGIHDLTLIDANRVTDSHWSLAQQLSAFNHKESIHA